MGHKADWGSLLTRTKPVTAVLSTYSSFFFLFGFHFRASQGACPSILVFHIYYNSLSHPILPIILL